MRESLCAPVRAPVCVSLCVCGVCVCVYCCACMRARACSCLRLEARHMAVGLRRRWIARRDGGGGGGLGEEMLADMLRQCCDNVATVLCHTVSLPNSRVAVGGGAGIRSVGVQPMRLYCRLPDCGLFRPA